MLHPSYQRRGPVSDPLSAVVKQPSEHKGVEAVTTDAEPRNEATVRMTVKKHGIALLGTTERDLADGGAWSGSEYWSLTREGWKRGAGESDCGEHLVDCFPGTQKTE